MPPIPIAASRLIAPVGIASTRTCGESAPIRMMAALPQVFSIWVMARLSAFVRASVSLGGSALAAIMGVLDMGSGPPGLRPEYIPKLRLAPSVFFQAEDGIRDVAVTGVQTCALPI